jgi:predicted nicotinamide N-methyase
VREEDDDRRLDPIEFVLAHTRVAPVPAVQELRLHQADDAFLLWETTERDLATAGIALPFWAFPWAGGTALTRHILDHPALVRGRRVLDLATGSGLVAIAAARAGAAEVIANDIDPLAIAATTLNAALNDVRITPLLADLLDTPDHPALEGIQIALAGDIAYERPLAQRIASLLTTLRARRIQAYIGDPGRAYLPRGLTRIATYTIPTPRTLEDADTKQATVWRLNT